MSTFPKGPRAIRKALIAIRVNEMTTAFGDVVVRTGVASWQIKPQGRKAETHNLHNMIGRLGGFHT